MLAERYTRFLLYAVQPIYFIQTPKKVLMTSQFDHMTRRVFLNVPHSENVKPSWFGESVGHYEGDTLVVDTIGLNDRFWLDGSGIPHTERLHLIERWTRTNYTTLRRDVTIEDPGAFTRPFTVSYTAKLGTPESEIMEYICIENNQYGLAQGLADPGAPK